MSKTIEITHNDSRFDDDQFTVVSPDHKSYEDAGGFSLPEDYGSLTEAGVTRVDIPDDKFFHLNRPHDNHVKITVEDEPQYETLQFDLSYSREDSFAEIAAKTGFPHTTDAYDALDYEPEVVLNITFEDGEPGVTSIEVDGETFTKE